jgi:tyrosyl-tRNA synthetase
MNLIEELSWRGMIQDIMPGTEELLSSEIVSGYVGFDPTADSLHIGSLVPILLLVHLQKAGHKPIALVGGATGMVGDPSGKSEERNLLSEEILRHNEEGIKKQLEKFLDFNRGDRSAEMVNNYDWFKEYSFLNFIRDVGKHITVNYMMAKDSVKKRIEGDTGMSFTEFTYQLVQGYDFYWLYENKKCKLQIGGSDQWGNIVTGTELIRRKAGGEAFAFTCPLITKADGGKFGKTEKGNVWLDPQKTSPYQFYQFWLNASDEDAAKWIKIFTFLPQGEIEKILSDHKRDESKRILQKKLAEEITLFAHGADSLKKILAASEGFFKGDPIEFIKSSDSSAIESCGIPIHRSETIFPIDVVSLLVESGSASSKGEARKLIAGGGISINETKTTDSSLKIDEKSLINNKYILIRKGKKDYKIFIKGVL